MPKRPSTAFDVDLLSSTGTECRRGQTSGDHQIVLKFAIPVSAQGGAVTPASGKTAEMDGPPVSSIDGNEVTVKLKNVTDVQRVVLTLQGVSDGTNTNNVVIPIGFLIGDTNGDGTVNSADAQQTRNRSGQLTDAGNFRSDVNTDGAVNSGDAFIVRARSGNSINP